MGKQRGGQLVNETQQILDLKSIKTGAGGRADGRRARGGGGGGGGGGQKLTVNLPEQKELKSACILNYGPIELSRPWTTWVP